MTIPDIVKKYGISRTTVYDYAKALKLDISTGRGKKDHNINPDAAAKLCAYIEQKKGKSDSVQSEQLDELLNTISAHQKRIAELEADKAFLQGTIAAMQEQIAQLTATANHLSELVTTISTPKLTAGEDRRGLGGLFSFMKKKPTKAPEEQPKE